MSGLESWLKQATRHLSRESVAQIRTEIQEHYDSVREAAISGGASTDEADRIALAALGDAQTTNCQYRKVLLTAAEARLLSEGHWEARVICSRRWLKWVLLVVPIGALLASLALFFTGESAMAWVALVAGMAIGLFFGAPFLPIYTPSRGRIFRRLKWAAFLGMFVAVFGEDTLKMSWLLISCLWPLFWIEWTRVSIRRKLPVAQWPKQLYL